MDGLLLVHKEVGMTSFDVIAKLRKILKMKRIGHSGTLDPNASGVLLVLLGNATKCLPYLEDIDKCYVATMQLGKKTLSDDIWDEVLAEKAVVPIDNFQELLNQMKGKIKQLPPYIASIKINGKKLYEYARNHEFIERPLRDVEIYDIKVLDEKQLKFFTHCSSGTYVRSICRDVAALSGNYGAMSSLVRTKVGRFSLDDCYSLADIEAGNFKLLTIKDILSHYPMINCPCVKDVKDGKRIKLDIDADEVVLLDNDEAIAIYRRVNGNEFKCERGLW